MEEMKFFKRKLDETIFSTSSERFRALPNFASFLEDYIEADRRSQAIYDKYAISEDLADADQKRVWDLNNLMFEIQERRVRVRLSCNITKICERFDRGINVDLEFKLPRSGEKVCQSYRYGPDLWEAGEVSTVAELKRHGTGPANLHGIFYYCLNLDPTESFYLHQARIFRGNL